VQPAQVATNNLEWYVYGSWDSYEDWAAHFQSKHIRKLRDWVADHDIIWKQSLLRRRARRSEY
jgi:quinol monooxygenase YgiN